VGVRARFKENLVTFIMVRLLVDSTARDPTLAGLNTNSTITRYDYEFAETSRNIKSLRLLSVSVPRSYYAVVAGYSQRFEFNYNGTDHAVNLPEGTYDGATLAAELTTLMQTASGSLLLTVTYDEKTNKLTFVNKAANTLTIYNQLTGYSSTFPQPGIRSVLGLQSTSALLLLTNTSATLQLQVNMSLPNYLYVSLTSGSANTSSGVLDWEVRRQYAILMTDTPYLGYKIQDINSTFAQCELFDNQQIRKVRIQWDHGLPTLIATNSSAATEEQEYPLNFNGVDHQLIFETS
jgi:hypothetical protein